MPASRRSRPSRSTLIIAVSIPLSVLSSIAMLTAEKQSNLALKTATVEGARANVRRLSLRTADQDADQENQSAAQDNLHDRR